MGILGLGAPTALIVPGTHSEPGAGATGAAVLSLYLIALLAASSSQTTLSTSIPDISLIAIGIAALVVALLPPSISSAIFVIIDADSIVAIALILPFVAVTKFDAISNATYNHFMLPLLVLPSVVITFPAAYPTDFQSNATHGRQRYRDMPQSQFYQ